MQYLESGIEATSPNGIYNFILFLAVDAALYFSFVLLIEYGLVKKLWHSASKLWLRLDTMVVDEDEDVLAEKEAVSTRGLVLLCSYFFIYNFALLFHDY